MWVLEWQDTSYQEGGNDVRPIAHIILYRAARLSASGRAVRTGHVAQRVKTSTVGGAIGKAGGWRRLWR